ncbi:hypothetical protein [Fusibacter sp. JL216-2]|uniref:hypothetical protein n=1 Tax=Fusibacter sp. JL216-2 TaxID=3071453 RepID=UPI003D32FB4C
MSRKYNFYKNGENFVKIIQRLLGSEFIQNDIDDGIEFCHKKDGHRIMKLVDSETELKVIFDVPIPDIHKLTHTIRHISPDKDGLHSHWIYEGTSIEDVVTLTEIAIENYRHHHKK